MSSPLPDECLLSIHPGERRRCRGRPRRRPARETCGGGCRRRVGRGQRPPRAAARWGCRARAYLPVGKRVRSLKCASRRVHGGAYGAVRPAAIPGEGAVAGGPCAFRGAVDDPAPEAVANQSSAYPSSVSARPQDAWRRVLSRATSRGFRREGSSIRVEWRAGLAAADSYHPWRLCESRGRRDDGRRWPQVRSCGCRDRPHPERARAVGRRQGLDHSRFLLNAAGRDPARWWPARVDKEGRKSGRTEGTGRVVVVVVVAVVDQSMKRAALLEPESCGRLRYLAAAVSASDSDDSDSDGGGDPRCLRTDGRTEGQGRPGRHWKALSF